MRDGILKVVLGVNIVILILQVGVLLRIILGYLGYS